jgi:ring-1,2-phenylacetyl-CoA epoxidase subunit PaaB
MNIQSLDPRVNRLNLAEDKPQAESLLSENNHFITYQVFHQKKTGDKHVSVGIVHAPSPEMALLFAKEQYGRRGETANIWIVATVHMHALDYSDADIFSTTPDKTYREASGYKVMDKINAYKKQQQEAQ